VSFVIEARLSGTIGRSYASQISPWFSADGYAASVRTKKTRFVSFKGWIVIVEPDDLIRQLLKRWLADAGYGAVDPVDDPGPLKVVPQLVIADISDPNSAAGTIDSLRAAYSLPILALSTRFRRGLGGSIDTAYRLNVSRVLPKPCTRKELLVAVAEAIGKP
jgi:CheY-like chemotaxis protein